MSAPTSHRNVQRSRLGTCTVEWRLLCHSTLQSCPHTLGEIISDVTHCLPTLSLVAAEARMGRLTYWRGRRGGRHRVGRCGVRPGWGLARSHLRTFHRNHLYCGLCISERDSIATEGSTLLTIFENWLRSLKWGDRFILILDE